jgi:hypothetical protein
MFILVFIVMFGPKKGILTTYASFWNFKYFNINQLLINFLNKNLTNINFFNTYLLYRFQFTIVTCRTTIYLLFSFWLFFFFFGESLLLILFNFSTVTDAVYSNYFFIFKNHTVFSVFFLSNYLSNTLMFYILFFTSLSFIFLLNLRFSFNYFYLNNIWFFDISFVFLFIYLFISLKLLFLLLILLVFNFLKN